MRKPYRLMAWGTGRMGKLCIWEISQSKAFELVGVRAYSESKNGVDAGTLIGVEPLGVPVSTDVESLLKVDCDCIVYTPRDDGTYPRDEEIP